MQTDVIVKIYKLKFSYLIMKRGTSNILTKSKRAQMQLSFGMIFSLILIIIFLAFAFYAIKIFLGIQRSAETGKFLNDFQNDINRVWRSAGSSEDKEYVMPKKISKVCFVDFSVPAIGEDEMLYKELKLAYYGSENLVFYPLDSTKPGSKNIENIDLGRITENENPYCLENANGKIKLNLIKELDESQVTVTRG